MNKTKPFIVRTFINGVIFLVPVVAIAWIFSGAISAVSPVYTTLQNNETVKRTGGPLLVFILFIIIIVLLIFINGILLHFTLLKRFNSWLEKRVLTMLPGYDLYKSMIEERLHMSHSTGEAVLVQWAESQQLGLKTEEHDNGTCTVYFPYSALTGGGAVHIVPINKVSRLNMTLVEMQEVFNRLGAGVIEKK